MPSFGERSRSVLATVDPRLQEVCKLVIQNYDFTVLEGYRTDERQEALFRDGKTTKRAGESNHNLVPSKAVDIAPWPLDWDDRARFFLLAGFMYQAAAGLGIRLRWGGDWNGNWDHTDQTFHDLPHFEIVE